jgi:hypothetical protein
MSQKPVSQFEKAASEDRRQGFLGETWSFMKENKKWWLLPIVGVLLLFGALVLLSGSAVAPFIYTLF